MFDSIMGKDRPNQIETKKRSEVKVTAKQLLDLNIPNTSVTEVGVRVNVTAALQYIEGWLRGLGAVGINNLMEDAATAEISRSQVSFQKIKHKAIMITRLNNSFFFSNTDLAMDQARGCVKRHRGQDHSRSCSQGAYLTFSSI